jgi:hypothetical protein
LQPLDLVYIKLNCNLVNKYVCVCVCIYFFVTAPEGSTLLTQEHSILLRSVRM